MIDRRQALAALAGGLGAACGAASPVVVQPGAPALRLDPLTDLVAAAGLVWLLDVRPQEVLADPALASLVGAAAPDDRLEAFAVRFGGVDLRRADEVVVAGLADSTFGLARLPVDPPGVEAAFTRRALQVEGRGVDRGVVRLWGTVGQQREQIAIFDRRAVGIEVGALGALRTAAYFAQGRLKRSPPALAAEPLASAVARLRGRPGDRHLGDPRFGDPRLGDAPVRGFAPGPFSGDWSPGLAGLLKAATAMAAALRPTDHPRPGALALRVLLTGAWGADGPAAAQRLEASFRLLGEDPLGRLTGLDQPLEGPVATSDAEALVLDVALDPVRISEGVRAIAGAPLAEMMAF
jgi:hypothetical protein